MPLLETSGRKTFWSRPAPDGSFSAYCLPLARVHPRYHVPVVSLWAQSGWAVLLALSGTYEQLYTYVVFVLILFHVLTALAVMPRPARDFARLITACLAAALAAP